MRPAIDAAKAAANEFVASMPADVRIGVETFGDDVTVLTPPTTDRALLSELINGIVTGGDTALYDVVVTASQHFTPTVENKVLVLLSDGKDDGSTATLDEAVAAVQGEHVEAISLTTAETDINSLSALGPVTSADDAAGVSAAFARVASLLAEVVEPTTVPDHGRADHDRRTADHHARADHARADALRATADADHASPPSRPLQPPRRRRRRSRRRRRPPGCGWAPSASSSACSCSGCCSSPGSGSRRLGWASTSRAACPTWASAPCRPSRRPSSGTASAPSWPPPWRSPTSP